MSNFYTKLKRFAPCFIVSDFNLTILTKPIDFYNALKDKSEASQKRIVFTSLYLGTGSKEKQLVESIRKSIENNRNSSSFRVHMLLDFNRGTRQISNKVDNSIQSSQSMCLPLLEPEQSYENKVKVSFYCTPNLPGVLRYLPHSKANEIVGLQHMKIYIIDDCLIISGANLSNDYFTNRQDRYVVIENAPELCDYFEELVNLIGEHSFSLASTNQLIEPSIGINPQTDNYSEFVVSLFNKVEILIQNYIKKTSAQLPVTSGSDNVAYIYPLLQLGLYGINQDYNTLHAWLRDLGESLSSSSTSSYKLWLASGYFNIDEAMRDSLIWLAKSGCDVNVLTAAPQANSFYKADRLLGYIPELYSLFLYDFFQLVHDLPVHIYEWCKPTWTFHAKGIWLSSNSVSANSETLLTFVGSTNYGERSRSRDLEAELLITTESPLLRDQMRAECQNLFDKTHIVPVSHDQSSFLDVSWWLQYIQRVIKTYL